MKVGDYVRFDYHRVSIPIQIAKITETHYDSEDDSICYSTDIGLVIDESNLVKEPSPNIIDLIEVGDYVNGRKVSKINLDMTFNKEKSILCGDSDYDCLETIYTNEDIKSIVTREMFESMEYKVGD